MYGLTFLDLVDIIVIVSAILLLTKKPVVSAVFVQLYLMLCL